MTVYYTKIKSPVGDLVATSDGQYLTGLYPAGNSAYQNAQGTKESAGAAPFTEVKKQLAEYFAGKRKDFKLPLKADGTEFQQHVWQCLKHIPYGETKSYQDVARVLKNPQASRAVGSANGKNPICIIIPCHRVINASGKLGGYNGGLHIKQWLLDHERKL